MGKMEFDKNLSIIFFFMRIVALWPYDFDRHLAVRIQKRYHISFMLNVLYYLFWQFICLHIAIFHIKTVLNSVDNLDNLFLVMVNAIIYCLMPFVNAYFRLCYSKNIELITLLKCKFKQRSAAGLTYVKFDSSRRYFIRLFKAWIITCILGALHWAVLPILQYERMLPLQCWYPFDINRSPAYELAYLGQVLGQLQVGIVYGIAGTLQMMYIFTVCGQYDILSCSLSNIYYTAMINDSRKQIKLSELQAFQKDILREPKNYYIKEVFLEELSKAPVSTIKKLAPISKKHHYLDFLQDELATAFDECIDHHVLLMNFCRLLEDCAHPFIMMKLAQMLCLLCLTSYMATVESLSAMKLINIVEYFMLTMVELFSFCYLGETLQNQSIKVSDALMTSNWYNGGAQFRQRVIILIMASQKPKKLTALKLFDLDFVTYVSVLKAAFSYYTLLKNLQN